MDKKELNELRTLWEATTKGEWSYDGKHNEIHNYDPENEDCDYFLICSALREHPSEKIIDEFGHSYNPDFEFIAKAHQSVPKLLDYINKLESKRDEWKSQTIEYAEALLGAKKKIAVLERAAKRHSAIACYICKYKDEAKDLTNGTVCEGCVSNECKNWQFDYERFKETENE